MALNISGLDAGTATRVRDAFHQVDSLVAGSIDRTKTNGRSLMRELGDRAAQAQLSHLRQRVMPTSDELSLGFTGRADVCDWSGGSPCLDPAPYEVHERTGTRHLCIGHLTEHRMTVHGFGPALRRERACHLPTKT